MCEHCDATWDGKTERRQQVCQFHSAKIKQIQELEKSKVSFTVFKIVITVLLTIGGGYWYKQDMAAKDHFQGHIELQVESNTVLQNHLRTSNIILRNMSKDVRETKLNLKTVMDHSNLVYQEIPGYYGPDN